MKYDEHFASALKKLHNESRYRTFIDIARDSGNFPHALWRNPHGIEKHITVWCGNDYLGMGQHPDVIAAMRAAAAAGGTGAGGARLSTTSCGGRRIVVRALSFCNGCLNLSRLRLT